MRIFSDFHHQDLFFSLQLLFEKRLGYELYRPIGMEWFPEYWKINDIEATAQQYLQMNSMPQDKTLPLNDLAGQENIGTFFFKDEHNGVIQKGITLEAFKNTKFDILIASIPEHIPVFKRLMLNYQPQAKLIYQIGNQWNIQPNEVNNVLASAKVDIPPSVNGVIYHQEFDLDVFRYQFVEPNKKIYSFINCLNTADLFKPDWELFLELERLMPDWEFKSFGGQTRDGAIGSTVDMANKMREATFIFQVKKNSDGYGHIIHNAMAIGRPVLINYGEYRNKLAGEVLVSNANCIDVDNLPATEVAKYIQSAYDSGFYKTMGENIYDNFKTKVDFDAEEKQIRSFIDKLR